MGILPHLRLMLICLDHCQGLILRHAIDNQMLHIAISLLIDAIQCTLQYTFGIKRTGNYGEFYHR